MIILSESAKKSLEDYLRQARTYLRGSRSVDANEVEQNITEHIENELEGAAEPVSRDALDAVLKKLGRPQQWVPEEELPWWWKIIFRLRSGPEDWRLAYLSFGLFLTGFIFIPFFLVFLTASYLVSRAAISLSNNNLQIKEQKWLIYPSLIVVNVILFLILLSWPLFISINIGYGLEHDIRRSFYQFRDDLHYWIMACSFIISSLGLWWVIFAIILRRKNNVLQMLCWPFIDLITKKLVFCLWLVGLIMMMAFTAVGLCYWLWVPLKMLTEFGRL